MTTPIAIGAPVTAAAGLAMRDRLVARGRRTTPSANSTSTTSVEVLRLDDIPVAAGVAYEVQATFTPFSTVLTDILRVEIRYTTNGATPTAASPVLPGGQGYPAVLDQPQHLHALYVPAVAETLSLVLTHARNSGSGTARLFADASRLTEIKLFSWGVDPGDLGVDL